MCHQATIIEEHKHAHGHYYLVKHEHWLGKVPAPTLPPDQLYPTDEVIMREEGVATLQVT
jgi:hypothetical protein